MSEFKIFETDEFCRGLSKLPATDGRWIQAKLINYAYPQLRKEPLYGPNIKRLRGYSPDTWRYRIGRYRVFYTVDTNDHIVFILTVDLRRDAYR